MHVFLFRSRPVSSAAAVFFERGGWVGGGGGARVGEGSGKLQVAENGRGGAAGGAGCCYFWIGSHPLKAKGERKKERTNKIERGRERERERVGRRAFVMDILFQP